MLPRFILILAMLALCCGMRSTPRCALPPALQNNTNLPGGGYTALACPDAPTCRASCCADAACRAFSFNAHATTNGTAKHHNCTVGGSCCYLKDGTYRHPRPQAGITSGILTATVPTPAPAPAPPAFSADRPNVLLLIVDDLRPELGAYGRPYMHTPRIDALAARSLLLEAAYVQQSLCGPSRASFLTGRRPDSTRTVTHAGACTACGPSRGPSCYWRDVGGNFTSLPQAFRQAGYWAASFGKTFDPRTSGGDCDAHLSWSQPPVMCSTSGEGELPDPGHASHVGVPQAQEGGLVDPPILSAALSFLRTYRHTTPGSIVPGQRRQQQKPAPFFLAVGFHRPHLPWMVPQRLLDRHYPANASYAPPADRDFAPAGVAEVGWTYSGELLGQYAFNSTSAKAGNKGWTTANGSAWLGAPNASLSEADAAELRRHYFAAVSATDELVGALLDEISALGAANNTIVALLGDHGWHLSENGLWGKCTNFEVGTRVPMLLGGSRGGAALVTRPGGLRSPSLVEAVDLLPTLLDVAGLDGALPLCGAPGANETLCREGVSLAPLLAAPATLLRTAAFSQYPVPGCGGVSCAGDPAPSNAHPSHMGYTMVTAGGVRFTEWCSMRYDNRTGAFEPQWGGGGLSSEARRAEAAPAGPPARPHWSTPVSPPQHPQCPMASVFELYDHDEDPGETRNLARLPWSAAMAAQVAALRKQLHAGWRAALSPV
jgi:iduronate 2-sulfatase